MATGVREKTDVAVPRPAGRLPSFISQQHTLVIFMTGFILIGTLFLPNPQLITFPIIIQFAVACTLPVVYAIVAHAVYHAVKSRSMNMGMDWTFRHVLARSNMARGIPTIIVFGAFILTFPSFKSNIPVFHPYSWDPFFASFDRSLHFGLTPWQLIASLTRYGEVTVLLDKLYYLWFPAIFMAVGVAAMAPGESVLRHRFLMSFSAAWIIIGVLMATWLSSVGPIFHDRLLGTTSEFTSLIANLERINSVIPLRTMEVREQLWQAYTGQSRSIVSGISAMPSMHNAICVLIFLAARHIHRYLAIAAASYAMLIFIGSVHLGWHYAADGYVSAFIVALIWKAAGWQLHEPGVGFFGKKG